jgi:dihydropyrimidinase
MGLLIKNGQIVTSDSTYVADIWCENETITRIEKNIKPPKGAEVVDATGKLVFPGFIDPHTHIFLPFMGTFAKDTFESATIAALCGGTTTLFDFAIPGRKEDPVKALETWQGKANGTVCSDYALHLCITRFDAEVEKQLREVIARGVTSFKIFLAYKGSLGIDDCELYNTLRFAKETGTLISAHCENADMVGEMQKALLAAKKLGPEYHHDSRPPLVEADGTRHFCNMAELLDVPIYIVHLSCAEALREACDAKLRGVKVRIETLITYLLLDKTYAERPNFEGAKYVMSPPLRDKKNQPILWNALESGLISTVGTDHAPFDTTQKSMGKDNFCLIPNGIPALEDRVRMLYTYGVCQGRLGINRFVEVASTEVAKIFGLFPRKGTIQIGSDADLVVYDPAYSSTISAKTHHINVDYNPFEGFAVKGRCAAVTVRGHIQVRDGEFVGQKGIGQFLKREAGVK